MEENNPVQPQQPIVEPPSAKKPFFSKTILAVFIIVILLILLPAATYLFLNSNKQIACTTEAKLCPDGSSVGRTGPKCEFAKCPIITPVSTFNPFYSIPVPTLTFTPLDTTTWKTYSADLFTIKYPPDWGPNPRNPSASSFWSPEAIEYQKKYPENVGVIPGYNISYYLTFERFDPNTLAGKVKYYLSDDKQVIYITDVFKFSVDGKEGIYFGIYGIDTEKEFAIPLNGKILHFTLRKYSNNSFNVRFADIFKTMLSTIKFNNSISPTPTCKPRPACLDANPRCLLPETSDMCPPKVTPSP